LIFGLVLKPHCRLLSRPLAKAGGLADRPGSFGALATAAEERIRPWQYSFLMSAAFL
jgi:hypothetical protein